MDHLKWQYARIFRTGVQARGWEPGWVFKVLGLKKSFSKFVAFGHFGAVRKAQKAFWVEKNGASRAPCASRTALKNGFAKQDIIELQYDGGLHAEAR